MRRVLPAGRRPGEHNHIYGAHNILLRALRLKQLPLIPNISWQHGWKSEHHQFSREAVALSRLNLFLLRLALVARDDEETFLRSEGVPSLAVGLPYAHEIDRVSVARRQNSMLVVPTHLYRTFTVDRSEYRNFVEFAGEEKRHFEASAVLLHAGDFEQGLHSIWIDAGWTVIAGAVPMDSTSLRRVASLFRAFEVVLTNGIGSHVPYAAAVGARISVSGPHWKSRPKPGTTDAERHDALGDRLLEANEALLKDWSRRGLLQSPIASRRHVEWGQKEVGYENIGRLPTVARRIAALRPANSVAEAISALHGYSEGKFRR